MSFLTPLALLLGLLAAPIILMYMLRLRRREVTVSSSMLWQKLLRDREANAPWQKLRRNLLLLLQLLILALLVFALARPFFPIPSLVTSNVVVLLDGSASMNATDVEPNRFTIAQEEVAALIDDLGSSRQMTLILAGATPQVIISAANNKTALREALATAAPEAGESDWHAAFALAAGAAQGFEDAKIIIVSDGGVPDDLPTLPAEVVYVPIGASGENLAITALATREGAAGVELFASVANAGLIDREALLSLTMDGVLYDSRRLQIPANSSANAVWELPEGVSVVQASLSEMVDDYLPLDNDAWAVHEGGISNRALLVTEGNLFLEQIYSVLPGIEAFKAAPDDEMVGDPFDLYVFDGVTLPNPLPDADMLIINPPLMVGEGLPLQTTAVFTYPHTAAIRLADSPLLQFVDWGNVNVQTAKNVSAPWAQTLVEAEEGPLLMIGEQNGRRLAILTFDLRDSDLPLQIAFPILMANITGWLSPGRAFDGATDLQAGDAVTIVPTTGATAVSVQKPDGTVWKTAVTGDPIIFSETDQLGLYQVTLQDSAGTQEAGSFAVNLFSPAESAIAPAAQVQVGQMEVDDAAADAGDVGQRELWAWLTAVAIIILIIEWWVHHRGLPARKRVASSE